MNCFPEPSEMQILWPSSNQKWWRWSCQLTDNVGLHAVAAVVLGGVLQVVEVELLLPADEHFELPGGEQHVDGALAGHQVKAPLEGEELGLHVLIDQEVAVRILSCWTGSQGCLCLFVNCYCTPEKYKNCIESHCDNALHCNVLWQKVKFISCIF